MARHPESNPYQAPLEFPRNEMYSLTARESAAHRFVHEVRDQVTLNSTEAAGNYFLREVYNPFHAFHQEELHLLLLNTRCHLTHHAMVYRGTIDMAPCRIAEIFQPAIQFNAASILIGHNHPSDSELPSSADVNVTPRLSRPVTGWLNLT